MIARDAVLRASPRAKSSIEHILVLFNSPFLELSLRRRKVAGGENTPFMYSASSTGQLNRSTIWPSNSEADWAHKRAVLGAVADDQSGVQLTVLG